MKNRKRTYDPASNSPFRISRSKIELFIQCPRCFYIDRRLGITRPSIPPYTLNNAVDSLLKSEFDHYRSVQSPHPLMEKYGIDAVPYAHADLEKWRNALTGGITYLHPETKLFITGGIDDIWREPCGDLIVVDYKASNKKYPVTNLDSPWHASYKRQIEIYQWLFRCNGFSVSKTGYFVFCNAQTDKELFGGRLDFDMTIVAYEGYAGWIDETLRGIFACLNDNHLPQPAAECPYCLYRLQAAAGEGGEHGEDQAPF